MLIHTKRFGWNVSTRLQKAKRSYTKIARSSNGRTTDSESVYLGSNPSLAAHLDNVLVLALCRKVFAMQDACDTQLV